MFQTHNSHLVFIGFTVPEVYKQEASGLQTEAAKLDLMESDYCKYFSSTVTASWQG